MYSKKCLFKFLSEVIRSRAMNKYYPFNYSFIPNEIERESLTWGDPLNTLKNERDIDIESLGKLTEPLELRYFQLEWRRRLTLIVFRKKVSEQLFEGFYIVTEIPITIYLYWLS